MHKPLLLKLTLLVLVVTLVSTGVTTFFVTMFATETLREKVHTDLSSDGLLIRFWLEELDGTPQQSVQAMGRQTERRITIVDQNGKVIADSEYEPGFIINLGDRPEFAQALSGEQGFAERRSATTGEERIYVAIPLEGGGAVRVAAPSAIIRDATSKLIQGALFLTLLVALGALAITYLINRNITDPLHDLLLVTKRLQNGEFGRRVLVRSRDEVGQLGRAFNDLSMTLEKMFDTIHDRESKLNAVLSSMEDGVLAVNTHRRVILANRAVAELIGEEEGSSLIGKDQVEVIRNFDFSEIIEDTMNKKKSINAEIKLYPGSRRTIAVSSNPLEAEDGSIIGVVAVLRDVSTLRRLEQMRREFVANVSHELRTPLTSIKGFVETILNGKTDDPALVDRFLRIVSGETDRMITLINDLLDLSRIESGKQTIVLQPVNITQIFANTIIMLESKASQKSITVENKMENFMVMGDAKLLHQVAINLVDNAIKYTKPGGRVWVEVKPKQDEVEIIIGDTGVGIPSEQIDRIFERFYRVDKGRSRDMGGTGLGLSIVKHIIDKHKGKIYAESRVGKGTQVSLTLQLAKEGSEEN